VGSGVGVGVGSGVGVGVGVGVGAGGVDAGGLRKIVVNRETRELEEVCATANELAVKSTRANVGSFRGMHSPSRLFF
jgi:hypothetical protein